MKRKDVVISEVYDARALRVIIGDKNGTLHGQAVQCCYNLLNIVHRWMNVVHFDIVTHALHAIGRFMIVGGGGGEKEQEEAQVGAIGDIIMIYKQLFRYYPT